MEGFLSCHAGSVIVILYSRLCCSSLGLGVIHYRSVHRFYDGLVDYPCICLATMVIPVAD